MTPRRDPSGPSIPWQSHPACCATGQDLACWVCSCSELQKGLGGRSWCIDQSLPPQGLARLDHMQLGPQQAGSNAWARRRLDVIVCPINAPPNAGKHFAHAASHNPCAHNMTSVLWVEPKACRQPLAYSHAKNNCAYLSVCLIHATRGGSALHSTNWGT
jgi:hypothetical protein